MQDNAITNDCTFCANKAAGRETIIYEDDKVWVARPQDMKQHKERIVVVSQMHAKELTDEMKTYACQKGLEIARLAYSRFPEIEKIAIMEDSKSRFPNHWHCIISDIDPAAPDYKQIIEETEYTEFYVNKK